MNNSNIRKQMSAILVVIVILLGMLYASYQHTNDNYFLVLTNIDEQKFPDWAWDCKIIGDGGVFCYSEYYGDEARYENADLILVKIEDNK